MAQNMKVTVCELPDDEVDFQSRWIALVNHVKERRSDLILLPEVPACPWFCHLSQFDENIWRQAVKVHDRFIDRLYELSPAIVISTRPIQEENLRLNQAFCWTHKNGYQPVHNKYYFPNEEGFYETRWFHRKERNFTAFRVNDISIGVLVCTELMFNEWARSYGKQGAHIIAVPRATGKNRLDRWLVALRMAAIVSGVFVLSSNRSGSGGQGIDFGGCGWIISPEGDILASTSQNEPFITLDIDINESVLAKKIYPRYIQD